MDVKARAGPTVGATRDLTGAVTVIEATNPDLSPPSAAELPGRECVGSIIQHA